MATKKKPRIPSKPPAKKVAVGTRGGKRINAGRVADDGATGIITNSIGLMPQHMEFLERQPIGKSVYIRKFLDTMIDLEKRKKAKRV